MKKVILVAVLLYAVSSFAEIINFNLKDDPSIYELLDNEAQGSITNDALIVTFAASDGNMNRTASGFGVNGAGTDDTDGLNAGQFMDVTFSQNVVFTNLVTSSWGGSDAGEVLLGPAFISQGSISGSVETTYGFLVDASAGETVRIIATSDSGATNGFSIDGFSVVIPEPAVTRLKTIGQWLEKNGEAIYGTEAGPHPHGLNWGAITQRKVGANTRLYLNVVEWPKSGRFHLYGLDNKILSASLLVSGDALAGPRILQPADGFCCGLGHGGTRMRASDA